MNQLLLLGAQDYPPDMGEIFRVAVRGIVFLDNKLLLIENALGEVKLPGGGMEDGETVAETLIREIREETGYSVIPASIRPFGQIEEKRLSAYEAMIWHHISRLYFCDVMPQAGACAYTENEQRRTFHRVLYTVDEAIRINQAMLDREGKSPWNQREYQTLLLLKDYLEN